MLSLQCVPGCDVFVFFCCFFFFFFSSRRRHTRCSRDWSSDVCSSDLNYVLRKIMRRAIYQGRHALGFAGSFFHQVTNFVIDQMGEAYPELEAHRDFIDKMVRLEEERFGSTLTVGLQKFDELLANTPTGKFPAWKDLARLYDTYGVPRDLIRVGLEERGLFRFTEEWSISGLVDEETFNFHFDLALQELQQTSSVGKTEQKTKTKPLYADVAARVQSLFRGYETTRVDDAKVLSLIRGDAEVSELKEGDDGGVVLDQTPFYAESGGQVGDVGKITAPSLTVGLPPRSGAGSSNGSLDHNTNGAVAR